MAVEVPEEAIGRFLAEVPIETTSPSRGLLEGMKAGLEAAAPLIVATAYDQIADQIAEEEGSGTFSSGVLRAVVKIQQAASVLRGEVDPK